MSPLKLISVFFVKLVFLYLSFVAVWEIGGGRDGYAAGFRAAGTALLRAFTFGEHGRVRVEGLEPPNGLWDSELTFQNLKTGATGRLPFGSRYWGYAPTTMVLTLILVSPVGWRRRGWALLAGLALVHLWIGLEVWLSIVNAFSGGDQLAVYTLGSGFKTVLSIITEFVTVSTVTRFAVPVFLWALVTFRGEDLDRIRAITGRRQRPAADATASS